MTSSEFENDPKDFQKIDLDQTMFDLLCNELEIQCKILTSGLLEVEGDSEKKLPLESLMRASHSIKGAARVLNVHPVVGLAHMMEDFFSAAQKRLLSISTEQIDDLFLCVDFLERFAKVHLNDVNLWLKESLPYLQIIIKKLKEDSNELSFSKAPDILKPSECKPIIPRKEILKENRSEEYTEKIKQQKSMKSTDRVVRITAHKLNHLMGLAGESLIESRWLFPFGDRLQTFKNRLQKTAISIGQLRENLAKEKITEVTQRCLVEIDDQINRMRDSLNDRLSEFDTFIHRYANLSDQIYQEVLESRMRPFSDAVEAFPRMIRDLAHQLGKNAKLETEGKSTPVDREILEKLEIPLAHLLRNAVDHGIETVEERLAEGKKKEGTIKLQARHRAGALAITVSDDGKGIDVKKLRGEIVKKNLSTQEETEQLTDSEIINFLFLPGFSTASKISEISGRGMGLNAVQKAVQEVGGSVRATTAPRQGVTFHLRLPLTLSVIRTLLVEISNEAYAFPLARIDHTILVDQNRIEKNKDEIFFTHEEKQIPLMFASDLFGLNSQKKSSPSIPVIILSEGSNFYGLIIDKLIGEKALVVHELDARLGKIPMISAGAIMEDGLPVLIVDTEEITHSMENLKSGNIIFSTVERFNESRQRILIVDDSSTVREVEYQLLKNLGYDVDVAVNGLDGWQAISKRNYDLIISDIDMPRMNGIELLRAIKSDSTKQKIPVIIVSFSQRESDRLKILEAGADYYLAKHSLHDRTLIDVIHQLLGNSKISKI